VYFVYSLKKHLNETFWTLVTSNGKVWTWQLEVDFHFFVALGYELGAGTLNFLKKKKK
jgi:hypothetical protein